MNPDYEIYRAREDQIPDEDKTRLDGYLAAKAEQTDLERLQRDFQEALRKAEQAR